MLIGYNQNGEEMGTMLIDSNILGSDESYMWGSNFGALIFQNFGSGDNWPWYFKIKIEVMEDKETCSLSEFFSVQWNYNL